MDQHFDNYEKFYANENKCTDSQRTDIVYSVEDAADPPSGTRKVIKNRLGKLDDIKKWSKDAFTITKQFVFESIGKCAITVDSILEYKMNTILENKRQYTTMLLIIRNTLSLFQRTIKLQRELAVTYENDKTFTPEESSSNHFKTTAIMLRDIVLSGEAFFAKYSKFERCLSTVCDKTLPDVEFSMKNYNNNRLYYDAYRLKLLEFNEKSETEKSLYRVEIKELENNLIKYRENFEQSRDKLKVKIDMFEKYRLTVLEKGLKEFKDFHQQYYKITERKPSGSPQETTNLFIH